MLTAGELLSLLQPCYDYPATVERDRDEGELETGILVSCRIDKIPRMLQPRVEINIMPATGDTNEAIGNTISHAFCLDYLVRVEESANGVKLTFMTPHTKIGFIFTRP